MPAAAGVALKMLPMVADKVDKQMQSGKNMLMATVSMMAARKAAKKAKQLEPPSVDNNQAQLNAELNAIRKGVSPTMKESIRQLNVAHANAAKDIMSASGGASGAAIAGLAGLDANVGDSLGKLYAADVPNQQVNMKNYLDSENAMIDRTYQIQANRFFNASAKAANLEQEGRQQMMTAINGGKESEIDPNSGKMLSKIFKKKKPLYESGGFGAKSFNTGLPGEAANWDAAGQTIDGGASILGDGLIG